MNGDVNDGEDILEDPDYQQGQDTDMPVDDVSEDEEDDTMSWEEVGYIDANDWLVTEDEQEMEEEEVEEEMRKEDIDAEKVEDLENESEVVGVLNQGDLAAINRLVAYGYEYGLLSCRL